MESQLTSSISYPLLVETFEAIGFDIKDEESYDAIAQHAENYGKQSMMYRGEAALHGRCWSLGEGIEVWAVLYENGGNIYYADCRPAFLSRYVRTLSPWELIEYDEDGEAILRGVLPTNTEVVLELQNLTAVSTRSFKEPNLNVALAGLAYTANIQSSAPSRFELADQGAAYPEGFWENDYFICGRVVTWREIRNAFTGKDVLWVYVDAGETNLEILVNRRALRGRLKIGACICAKVWLQGHILESSDLAMRYEGVDRESVPIDFWPGFRRGN